MAIFVREIEAESKQDALQATVARWRGGAKIPNIFLRSAEDFAALPGVPWSYWIPGDLMALFSIFSQLSLEWGDVIRGPELQDMERDMRCWWEVESSKIGPDAKWSWYAKGGAFKRFATDVHLVIDYGGVRAGAKEFRRPGNDGVYFIPGITFSQRTSSPISFRCLPADCLTSPKGPAVLVDNNHHMLSLLAICNSGVFRELMESRVGAAGGAARSYDLGILRETPVPQSTIASDAGLPELAQEGVDCTADLASMEETDISFVSPCNLAQELSGGEDIISDTQKAFEFANISYQSVLRNIDKKVCQLYGVQDRWSSKANHPADSISIPSDKEIAAALISYFIGAAFGRWDVRHFKGRKDSQFRRSAFDSLPQLAPGMFNEEEPSGDTISSIDGHLDLCLDGIACSGGDLESSLPMLVRRIISRIWGDVAVNIEEDVCRALNVRELHNYIDSCGKFFSAHLKRYTRSGRKAPIYWPLSTSTESYILWIYYPDLDDQTLYTAVNDFLEPKLKLIADELNSLRAKSNRSAAEERELEKQQDLEQELIELRDTILEIAPAYKPNHDDGVQITAAPLWPLFRHKPWQKVLKDTWEKLEAGEYDWAHLAYSYWPERVREKCKTDKSLAIAHGLEDLYEEPAA